MPSTRAAHDEVETKVDVEDNLEIPRVPELLVGKELGASLADGGVESVELDATYLDTADLRLLQAGWTLRRRSGGDDAGWTLKIPYAEDSRHEVSRPLGRGSSATVPVALRRMTWAVTRGQRLVPVARLTTSRTVHHLGRPDGQVLADICDDRVEAVPLVGDRAPMSWREVEVELVDGGPELLGAVVRRLGRLGLTRSVAPSKLARALDVSPHPRGGKKARARQHRRGLSRHSSAGQVVLAYLSEQLDQILSMDPLVQLDEPGAVHQMRVATRRSRSALKTFGALFDDGPLGPLEVELRWLAGELGHARDAEVLRTRLLEEIGREQEPGPAGPLAVATVGRLLERTLSRTRAQAQARVKAALHADRYHQLVTSLEAFLADAPTTPRAARSAVKELPKHVRAADRTVRKAMRASRSAAGEPDHDVLLHTARKKAKQARYAAEAVTPALGEPAGDLAAAMESVQERLGDYHDQVELRSRLRALAAEGGPEAAFVYGRLDRRAEQRQAGLIEDIDTGWKAASKKSLRRWLP